MAHLIQNEEIAFVGETPWHGLGTRMPPGATDKEMLAAAKLDWEVALAPIAVDPGWRMGRVNQGQMFGLPLPVQAILRTDTGRYFGVTNGRYTPVQNQETVSFFREFCDSGDVALETVGAINGGEWVWALARVNEEVIRIDNDLIAPYLLIANSHVPGNALVVKATMVRVVCNNTLTWSLQDSMQVYGRFAHSKSIHDRLSLAKDYVRAAIGYQHLFRDSATAMIRTPVSLEQASKIIQRIFKVKPASDNLKRVLALFQGEQIGADRVGTVDGNAWGLFNATTEFIDHEAGRTQDNRLRSAWFGPGERLKQGMLGELLKLSTENETS